MITSHFPAVGQQVLVDQQADGVLKEGVCCRVAKPGAPYQAYCVAFENGFWLAFGPADGQFHIPCRPWAPCPESRQVTVASALFHAGPRLPEGFMCNASRVGSWTLFERYRHPWHKWPQANGKEQNAILEARWFCPKEKWRLPPLQAGDIVHCRGKVLSRGSGGDTGGSLEVTFVAWAQGACGIAAPQVKNFAIVALPGGELTWAALAGREAGYISLSSPPRTASSEELEVLRAQLPEFLSESTASDVSTQLGRAPDVDVSPAVAETRQAAAAERARQLRDLGSQGGSSQGGSSQGGSSQGRGPGRPPTPRSAPCATEVLHKDLKSVRKATLMKLPVLQLQALCTDKGIAFDMTAEPQVTLTLTPTRCPNPNVSRCQP